MRILENGEYKYTWQQEKQMLEDAFARQLLIKYNIKEVTTQRQAINGTREFEFPVSSLAPKTRYGRVNPNQFPKLRLACFKTGYVRKQNGCYSPYQLNPTYKRKKKWVFLEGNKTVTKTYNTISRARIYSGLARLNYMLEYYLKNYKQNTNTVG
tara:strand:- start:221 stop:682 length:462 start_codon:yes stop_codon:yes gene_type:complete